MSPKLRAGLPRYLLAAILAGYMRPTDWREWADEVILSIEDVPHWVINLSLASNADEARAALIDTVIDDEVREIRSGAPSCSMAVNDVSFGYLWLMFEEGRFDFPGLLEVAGVEADRGVGRFSPERIYDIHNRYEEASAQDAHFIQKEAENLFLDFRKVAESQWGKLSSPFEDSGPVVRKNYIQGVG